MNSRREIIAYCILVAISIAIALGMVLRNQHAIPKPKSYDWGKLAACKIDKHYLEGMYGIHYTPEVQTMEGKPITLDGFVVPLEATPKFSHFLLSVRAPSCPYCPPAAPNELVEVFAKIPMAWSDQLVSMRGRLKLGAAKSDTGIFFQMVDADVVPAFEDEKVEAETSPIPTSMKPMSEYRFTALSDTAPTTIAQWAGKPLLVSFWRSDCAPCLHEMEVLPIIAKQHQNLSVALISLQNVAHTRAHLPAMPANIHPLVAQADGRELLTAFGNDRMLALPYSVMLDAKGAVCGKHYGIITPEKINAWWKQCSLSE